MGKIFYVSAIALVLSGLFSGAQAQESSEASRYLREPLPEKWDFTPRSTMTLPSEDKWWKHFEDATLDSLVTLGIENNYSLLQASHRREMARIAIQQARSAYYPSIGLSAGYSRAGTLHAGSNAFSLGADANWEIDLFGKITNQVKSSKAAYNASRADYLATMVSITSEIATYYINYRVLQSEIQVAEEHIENQAKVLRIAEARHEAGLVSKLDVAQAKTVYYNTEAMLPKLRSQAFQTLNAIAILLGVYPSDLIPALETSKPLPSYQQIVPVGVPAALLRRRPDVVAAEAQLIQYASQIGLAKKDFLPTLSITGNIGWAGDKINKLVDGDNLSWSVAPKLSWTLFEGFSRKYALASAKEQMLIGIDAYNLAVLNAYVEVENAIVSYHSAVETFDLNKEVLAQSRESFELSMEQYKEGLSSFTNVVDAQTDWLECANTLVSAHGSAIVALIDLYKALGGGY